MATAPPSQQAALRAETRSEQILAWARQHLAGGDSSTMRVVPYHLPLVAVRGEGPLVWDADGNEILDMNMAYGPLILGHCPPAVIAAVCRQVSESGSQLGFPTEIAARVAEKLKRLYPHMELLRFANSGTEAMMFAARLARTATKRTHLVVMEGGYHGWSDALFHRYHAPLDQMSTGPYGPAIPGTLGMNGAPRDLLTVPYNNLDALEACLNDHADQIAAVIMEPVMGNAGVIPPAPGYLEGVRYLTREHESLLIFDEVISGLRVAAGGAQEIYGVTPDVTVVSKALGGGYPVAACGASRELMGLVVRGELFHGGVYAGNAVVMAAAEAVLDEILANPVQLYEKLNQASDALAHGLHDVMQRLGIPHVVQHVGAMCSLFLTDAPVPGGLRDYRAVRRHCDLEKYINFQHHAQRLGVYFHPNQFEPMYLSTTHEPHHIASALERIEEAAKQCLAD